MENIQQQHSNGSGSSSTVNRIANGLGWFSVGLGLAELVAPGAVADLVGVRRRAQTRNLLRFYGARELAAGVGILTKPQPAGWLWARVAGDALDISSIVLAMGKRRNEQTKLALALASVAGITAADIYCATQLSASNTNGASQKNGAKQGTKVIRTIIVDRPAEQVYNFWRDFENLPRFMTYLDSVRHTENGRTHWTARGPAGTQVEWDAETVSDEPNRRIAWKSVPDSKFENSGSVRFERAPGDRGTLIRVEMELSSNPGVAALEKMLRMDLGRRITHDLRNFKQVIEVGEVTQSDASIHPGMHAARPDPVAQQ